MLASHENERIRWILSSGKKEKQLSRTKEKELATFRPKRNDRSSEETPSEGTTDMQEHSLNKQLLAEEAKKPIGTEPIHDISVTEKENRLISTSSSSTTTASNHDYNQDYVLNVFHDLPEQWIGKEQKLHVIADKKDAARITKRVFEVVERG